MPSPVKKKMDTSGLNVTIPTHASKDTPKIDKLKINNYFFSTSNVLSMNPDEDRLKIVITQDIHGCKDITTNVIDYGK